MTLTPVGADEGESGGAGEDARDGEAVADAVDEAVLGRRFGG